MTSGRYDSYQRRVTVTSQTDLKDGDPCLVLPHLEYIAAQYRLLQIIAEEHEGNFEKAVDEFLATHAEAFNAFWRRNPEKRKQLPELYLKELIESGTYNHR
ncbi:hypothetical protein HYT55_05495 [Candidatus Woesearchaeota archaeon]|nr:hypothetical protein [Candidatus Woesearchaeota archaeon]